MTMNMATEPKSDQMNYDDFIGGVTKTITITDIKSSGNADAQPISIHYEGDNGKPYKPCKSMRRVMVHGWGDDGLQFVGKSMTLYGDPSVKWAGKEVGGIRISHMSNIEREMNVSLTSSQGKRKLHQVKPLKFDMGNVDEEIDYQELTKKAQDSAAYGSTEYKEFFLSLSKSDKKRLDDSGDHENLKTIAKSHDADEIPVDPPSQDHEAGNVEPEETSPPVDAGSTTPEPITDESKWLSSGAIIKDLEDCGNKDEVTTLITCQSLSMDAMTTSDNMKILKARDARKKELSNG